MCEIVVIMSNHECVRHHVSFFVENRKYLPCASMYCTECGEIPLRMYTDSINFCCCSPEGEVIGELV